MPDTELTPARLWKQVGTRRKVRCFVCPRLCLIEQRSLGLCLVRRNIKGSLYALTYGDLSQIEVEPIEKTPLYHFWPGSMVLSIGSIGCNFTCQMCQTWRYSQALAEDLQIPLDHKSPEEVVGLALKSKATSIAFTYNEPIIWFEYVLDTARQAHKNGIKTILVTNGYATEEALKDLLPHVDAAHVDLKAISDRFYRKVCGVPSGKPVLKALQIIHERGIHLEISNLLIPTLNDNLSKIRMLVEWVYETLGTKVPIHFSAFMPAYKMLDIQHTPTKTVVSARQIARKVGLEYVYTGNIRGHEGETTYCSACDQPVIKRFGSEIIEFKLKQGNTCPHCQKRLEIIGEWVKSPALQGDKQPS